MLYYQSRNTLLRLCLLQKVAMHRDDAVVADLEKLSLPEQAFAPCTN